MNEIRVLRSIAVSTVISHLQTALRGGVDIDVHKIPEIEAYYQESWSVFDHSERPMFTTFTF